MVAGSRGCRYTCSQHASPSLRPRPGVRERFARDPGEASVKVTRMTSVIERSQAAQPLRPLTVVPAAPSCRLGDHQLIRADGYFVEWQLFATRHDSVLGKRRAEEQGTAERGDPR